MRVDLEEVLAIQKRHAEINDIPFEELEVYENGVKVDINPEIIEEWKYVGLGNFYFIADEFYKKVGETNGFE
jgi:hypothetical protein